MLLRLAAGAVLVLALAACGGDKAAEPKSGLAPGCEVPVIERTVKGFFAAVTAGDRAAIARHLSPDGEFVRLTVVDADRRFTTSDRAKAIAYLVGRHRLEQRERMLQLRVSTGVDANHDSVQGLMTRIALDFRARGITTRLSRFDGAVNCVRKSITRWRVVGA
jgi:hypothetical protein